MVSTISFIGMIFSLLASALFPILLGVVLYRKWHFSIRALLVGVLIFLVFQVFTRIPGLQILAQTEWYRSMAKNIWLLALFLGLTAGIFEEVGRWLGMRYMMKKQWDTKNGIAFGIGHGGIESLVLVSISMVSNLIISWLINTGMFDQAVGVQMGPEASSLLQKTLVDTPPYLFFIGGLERVMVILIHIGLSLVVLESVRRSKPVYLLYAILLHALLDIPVVLLSGMGNAILLTELYVLVCAVISVIYIRSRLQKQETVTVLPEVSVLES